MKGGCLPSPSRPRQRPDPSPIRGKIALMQQNNTLDLINGGLVVAVIVLGVYLYREETKPAGAEVPLDQNGVSVQEN